MTMKNRPWSVVLAIAVLCSACGGADPGNEPAQPQQPLAANVLDATALFDWVPTQYGSYFSGSYVSGTTAPYTWRYYPATRNYLAVANGEVFILGPVSGNQVQSVGPLTSFNCRVFPSNCAPAVPPASSMAGLYLGSATSTSAGSIMLVAGDGKFIGYNVNGTGTQMDVFHGTATVQGTAWSTSSALFGHYGGGTGILAGFGVATSASFSGAFQSGNSISATVVQRSGAIVSSRLSMAYYSQSNTAASLATIGGSYSTPSQGQSITIDATTGVIGGTLAPNCTISGAASVTEPTRNVYSISATLTGTGCPGTGNFDMLGYYYTANNGAQSLLAFGINGGSQSAALQFVTLNMPRRS